jgi:hypothetical protein
MMPKNSSSDILKRWKAMDAALGSLKGLSVAGFARQWKVSTKTVRRDLEAFREIGQRVIWERDDVGRCCWSYEGGVEWLFVSNVPWWARDRLRRLGET